jgi:hypothetical protein
MGKRPTSNTGDVLSASEIGQYVFCSNAWRLRRMGYEPESPFLGQGTKAHVALGNQLDDFEVRIRSSHWYIIIGLALLTISFVLLFFGVIL